MKKKLGQTLASMFYALLCFTTTATGAQEAPAQPQDELAAALDAARATLTAGPADISLRDQAILQLTDEFLFVPAEASARLLRAWGNRVDERLLGLVFPAGEGEWFAVLEYEKSGYVQDDDAKDWDADELLESLKLGTEESNVERKSRGIPEMEIVGWVEPPTYDAATHRLVWSLSSKDKGAPATENLGINYNTYALGREGYVSINLVTDLGAIETEKSIAKALLSNLAFNDGKRYADFDEATDAVAAYGLAALVGGAAAKKLGFFALVAAFFAKFAKLIVPAAIGIGALIFRRKKA